MILSRNLCFYYALQLIFFKRKNLLFKRQEPEILFLYPQLVSVFTSIAIKPYRVILDLSSVIKLERIIVVFFDNLSFKELSLRIRHL